MASYSVFESATVLARALQYCWRKDTLPKQACVLSDGRLAVPSDGFIRLEHIAKQHGWRIETQAQAKGHEIEMTSLVGGEWTYRDPMRWQGPTEAADTSGLETRYRPDGQALEYILAASDRVEATALLDLLTSRLTDHISVVPVELQKGAPYQFFWLVSGKVSFDVLQRAPRVWWGPAGVATRVFLQWPYSLRLPAAFLQRLPWASDQGLVLLSRTAPELLIVKVPAGGMLARPMEDFGDLQPLEATPLQVVDAMTHTEFPVRLCLAPDAARNAAREMVRCRSEMAALKERLAQLEGVLERLRDEHPDGGIAIPDPLLFFFSQDASRVPRELRRLLIEWSNQPGDLEALAYARIDATRLPRGLDQPYDALHVVTTMRAIGRPTPSGASLDSTLGERLLAFSGASEMLGARPRFQALREWHAVGLRLFVPHDFSLRLYPQLAATPSAADKLANALLGRTLAGEERERLAILLVDGGGEALSACPIETSAFKPLASAFDWECAVNVDPLPAMIVADIREYAKRSFVNGLAVSLDEDFMAEEHAALQLTLASLRLRMSADMTAANQHEVRARRIRTAVEAIDARWTQITARSRGVLETAQRLEHGAQRATEPVQSIAAAVTALSAAAEALDTERRGLAQERQLLEQLRTELESRSQSGRR